MTAIPAIPSAPPIDKRPRTVIVQRVVPDGRIELCPPKEAPMVIDEKESSLADKRLTSLLNHYVHGNEQNREMWQNRVMEVPGVRPEELVRLHGRLLASEWIEQNIGAGLTACYRATAAGRKVLKLVAETARD
jgi:hypothetical protein